MCAISFHAAKDLIRGLLKTDPRERYAVEQVINNPWIKVLYVIIVYIKFVKMNDYHL